MSSHTGSKFCCYVAYSVGSVLLSMLLWYSEFYITIIVAGRTLHTSVQCTKCECKSTDYKGLVMLK